MDISRNHSKFNCSFKTVSSAERSKVGEQAEISMNYNISDFEGEKRQGCNYINDYGRKCSTVYSVYSE